MNRFVLNLSLRCILLLACMCLLPLSTLYGQMPPSSSTTATPVPGVGHDYLGNFGETVNPATGSVNIHVSTMMPPGRKLTIPFSFVYSSSGVNYVSLGIAGGQGWQFPSRSIVSSGGWAETAPIVSVSKLQWTAYDDQSRPHPCFAYVNYMYQDTDGERHNLNLTIYNDTSQSGPCTLDDVHWPVSFDGQIVTNAGEGSWGPSQGMVISSIPLTVNGSPIRVTHPDGTVFYFPQNANQDSLGAMATTVEDRNGNVITITPPASASAPYSYSDTLGRTVLQDSGFGISPETVTIPGLNIPGSSGSYKVYWTNLARPTFTVPVTTLSGSCSNLAGPPAWSGLPTISSITLPNGKSYSFSYDPAYGLVNKVTYPTGAYIRYVWGIESQAEFVAGRNPQAPCTALYGMPVITERYVSFDGSTEVLHQHFAYTTSWNTSYVYAAFWTSRQTTVTTTDQVRNTSYKTIYTYSPAASPQPPNSFTPTHADPVESSIGYYDTNGALLKTVTKTWTNLRLLTSEMTQYPNGSALKTAWSYNSREQMTEQDEYDFGASGVGSLLRKITTNYQQFANTPIYAAEPSIVDRPCQVITYDGSGTNRVAETDFFYDNGATGTPCAAAGTPSLAGAGGSSLTGHDVTNYSVSSSAPRGNLTQKTQWLNTGTSPSAVYSYDETGQTLSLTDAMANSTSYSYTDSFLNTNSSGYTTTAGSPPSGMVTNAFVTQTTYPTTNSISHVVSFSYGYNDGELTQSTDQNLRSTTYKYNDYLGRLTEADLPDGGQTARNYNDTVPSVTTTSLITSSLNMGTTSTMDKMGHPTQTQLTTDPDGITSTVTIYDGDGRRYKTYNPTRCSTPTTNCGTETTWGYATYTYDALGRTSNVLEADGSNSTISYSANQTTVTDETGRKRTTQVDALGRVTFVWEDPTGVNYETDYLYDALGNLMNVTQKGGSADSATWRTRTFTYDSLSRLLCAANPEIQIATCPSAATGTFPSGSIKYTYDLNGNLLTRVEPKAGQTSTAQTTTTYSYDALNRLFQKTYTNPVNSVAKYAYDGTSLSGCGQNPPTITNPTNLIGRRSANCAQVSGVAWSYDVMGRPLLETRINQSSGQQTKFSVGYSYNLDGSLKTVTYPSGDVLTYAPGGAGRPLGLSDASNPYVANATYAPQGALATMTNGTGIGTLNFYNSRLQPLLLSASVASGSVFSLCYDFHLGQAINKTPCSFSSYATGDNGNVFQIQDNVDPTRSVAFIYDSLNRTAQAYTTNTSSANCWGETYSPNMTAPGVLPSVPGVDAWGNLTNRSGVTGMGSCLTESLSATATTQNQLGGIGMLYDAAGNVTNDGRGNQPTYDAENRIATDAGVTYYYDADGQRMEKSAGTKYWFGSSGEILSEASLTGTINEEYVFFNGNRIARIDRPGGAVHYYFSDRLGSTSLITGPTGTVQERCFYFPFGGTVSCTGSDPNHYLFTGKERDTESGLDYFIHRHYASTMGRFMQPDPAGMMAVDIGSPQTLNRYTYVLNNPLSFTDPFGLDCAYLNSSGTGVEKGGIDQHSSSRECGRTGGYWAEGSVTNVTIGGDAETVSLTGTTNGNTNNTSASYQQNATIDVGEFHNTMFNPYNHIALGLHGGTLFGQNPRSDSQFVRAIAVHGLSAVVPGAIKPQVGGQLLNMVHIPVTGMQAQMVQDEISQTQQNPPPYSVEGGGPRVCDCASWAQQVLGDAGINSGARTPWPDTLMQQLNQNNPPQQ